MNSDNLIRLGAFAQRSLNMQDDFQIVRVSSDAHRDTTPVPGLAHEYNIIILNKVVFRDDMESIRIGYSSEANVLVIQE